VAASPEPINDGGQGTGVQGAAVSGFESTCRSTIAPADAAASTRSRTFLAVRPLEVPFQPAVGVLVAPRGDRYVVHQLDLPTGRPHLLPALPLPPLSTYDGARVVLVAPDGIEWVEATDGRWKVVWRELTNGEVIHAVERSEQTMAALFTHQRQRRAWQWELPGVVLQQSGNVELPQQPIVLASGNLGILEQGRGVAKLFWHCILCHRLNSRDLFPGGKPGFLVSRTVFGTLVEAPQFQSGRGAPRLVGKVAR
jgi:hypothetical protein